MAGRKFTKSDYMKRDWLVDAVRTEVQEKSFKVACEAAAHASEMMYYVAMKPKTTEAGRLPYRAITGNLLASMGITVSRFNTKTDLHTRARSYAPISSGAKANNAPKKPVKGPSLRGGQTYDTAIYGDRYYDGGTVGKRPYKAPKSGLGGDYGAKYRAQFIKEITTLSGMNYSDGVSSKGNFWNIYCYIAAPYAKIVESKHQMRKGETVMQMSMYVADYLHGNASYGGSIL